MAPTRSGLRLMATGLVLTLITGLSWHWSQKSGEVDTQAMLDVSVTVKTVSHVRIDQLGDSVWEQSSGSGFIVSSERCEVWTNHHVVADAALVSVIPTGWTATKGINATVVHSTPRGDMAVLRLDNCDGLPQARLGNSSTMKAGDDTYAVGNPLGRNPNSISRGIISHTERYARGVMPYLQTDAAINPGNSGGALFNSNGQVIGVNVGLASNRMGMNVGVGYAVPIDIAKLVVAGLESGPPSWGSAGLINSLSELSAEKAEMFGVPSGHAAVIVTKTPETGPSAGQVNARDVIFRINDHDVGEMSQVARLITAHAPGEYIDLILMRDGALHMVQIVLEEGWNAEPTQTADYFSGYLGMELENWSHGDIERGRSETPVITKVHSLGPAHRAQISSSQRSVRANGPFLFPYQLDVKTITGVVFDGKYHEVTEITDVDHFAHTAYQARKPLLLEIALWTRANTRDITTDLQHTATGFFKISPELTTVVVPISGEWHPVSRRSSPAEAEREV